MTFQPLKMILRTAQTKFQGWSMVMFFADSSLKTGPFTGVGTCHGPILKIHLLRQCGCYIWSVRNL